MTQVVEHLPSKFQALSSKPSTNKKKKKRKEMDDFLVSFSWSLGQQISDLLNNLGV
jgi:hypothetical protein